MTGNKNRKIIFKRILSLVLVFLNMLLIFLLSAENAEQSAALSAVFSDSLAYKILDFFNFSPYTIEFLLEKSSFIVRKTAHFSEYALLGFLLSFACRSFGLSKKISFAVSQVTGSLYAVSDEIHQLFVDGRSCEFRDMAIDWCGVFFGIAVFYILRVILCKIKSKKKNKF